MKIWAYVHFWSVARPVERQPYGPYSPTASSDFGPQLLSRTAARTRDLARARRPRHNAGYTLQKLELERLP